MRRMGWRGGDIVLIQPILSILLMLSSLGEKDEEDSHEGGNLGAFCDSWDS